MAASSQRQAEGEGVGEIGDDPLPPGQVASWLRFSILSGRLFAGNSLPSIRELSKRTGVNVNTVRATYAELEREGLVTMRHGSGSFVADHVRPAPALEIIATAAVEQARAAGIETSDLLAAIQTAAGEAPSTTDSLVPDSSAGDEEVARSLELRSRLGIFDLHRPTDDGRAAVRRELRRQITFLESLLRTRDEETPPAGAQKGRGAPARVADVDELERVRDELLRRLDDVRLRAHRARPEDPTT